VGHGLRAVQTAPCAPPDPPPAHSSAHQIITYSDLESDYLNPLDATERLNRFLIPEYVAHTALTILFLLSLNFVPLIANGALSAWHVKCYLEKQHLVDATRIYPMLAERKKQCLVKLGFYTIMFFYYMYRMIYALVWGRIGAANGGSSGSSRFAGR